jgi:hypothetical protein
MGIETALACFVQVVSTPNKVVQAINFMQRKNCSCMKLTALIVDMKQYCKGCTA